MKFTNIPRTIHDIKAPVTAWDYWSYWKQDMVSKYILARGKRIHVK